MDPKAIIKCDMDPNKTVEITVEKCLSSHQTAIRTEIMDRKMGKIREYKPCLKCPTALNLMGEGKTVEFKTPEPIIVATPPAPRPETKKTAPVAEIVQKGRVCLECQEDKFILGRGLCGSCYHKLKKRGQLEKYPAKPCPTKKQNPAGPEKAVTSAWSNEAEMVDEKENQTSPKIEPSFLLHRLEKIPGLLDFLKNRMEEGFRETLENQILFELRNSMHLYQR